MPATKIDGTDVEAVWSAAHEALQRARGKKGPSFVHATCLHSEGHFLGDPLLRIARNPVKEMKKIAGPLLKSVTKVKGASVTKRTGGLCTVTSLISKTTKEQVFNQKDPLRIVRGKLKAEKVRLQALEDKINEEIRNVVAEVLVPKN